MTAIVRPEPGSGADPRATAPRLRLNVLAAHKTRVVHVTGEVDLATRDQLVSASTAGHHPHIVIDLGGVTFMDCGGYGALVASQRVIESQGRTLAITGQTGQPSQLFDMIAELEKCPLRPGPNHQPASAHQLSNRGPGDSVGVRVAAHSD